MPFHDPAEDLSHGGVIKRGDADGVEVAQEARRDGIAATSGRSHGTYHLNIHQMDGRSVLKVIPEGIKKKKEKLNKPRQKLTLMKVVTTECHKMINGRILVMTIDQFQ